MDYRGEPFQRFPYWIKRASLGKQPFSVKGESMIEKAFHNECGSGWVFAVLNHEGYGGSGKTRKGKGDRDTPP
jgi:hypothetical protein